MTKDFLKAIVILPGTALVYVPALVLWATRNTGLAASVPRQAAPWIAGLALAAAGLTLMIWTMRLYLQKGGGGTPAPWQPIRNLLVVGPYRHVRNPMLSGVLLFQTAEAVLLQSLPLGLWAAFFFCLNTVYFVWREEPELLARFGEPYAEYRRHVPRWLPRLTPYRP